ncbi:MAG: hypothetical protein ACOYM3_16470 [Terrimicrobiaceae bacterium]
MRTKLTILALLLLTGLAIDDNTRCMARSCGPTYRLVAESFARDGFESLFWKVATGFEPDWSNGQDLRTVDSARRPQSSA